MKKKNDVLPCGCSRSNLNRICKELHDIPEKELMDITKTKWYNKQKKKKKEVRSIKPTA